MDNEKPRPNERADVDEFDDAVMSADDTGMVAQQHLIVEEEILEAEGGEAL